MVTPFARPKSNSRLGDNPGGQVNPIGADESFTIQGSYPDEIRLSTTYTGGQVVYKWSGTGSLLDRFETEQEQREFYDKDGKEWDPKLWPMAPSGPDSAAAVRYEGTNHVSVYFSFNFNYIQEDTRRAAILDRVLDWLNNAASSYASKQTAAEELIPEVPDVLTLGQNYPNPFNPTTQIKIGVPKDAADKVSLKIYNVRGQLVKTLFEGNKAPGVYTFEWNGTNSQGAQVSSGVYFYRVTTGKANLTRKMIMLK